MDISTKREAQMAKVSVFEETVGFQPSLPGLSAFKDSVLIKQSLETF
jgi:hypothetical protein